MTAFHGTARPYEGLGMLPWSNTVHYDAERGRADEYRGSCTAACAPGFAAEDGSALHFVDERLRRTVASRPGARAFRMRMGSNGRVARTPLRSAYLGDGLATCRRRRPTPSLRVA